MPSGLRLAATWYRGTVAPALADVPHAAALIGDGSEVLGLDDVVSTDHDFGRRVQIFVEQRFLAQVEAVAERLERAWPAASAGSHDLAGVVQVAEPEAFFTSALGVDPLVGLRPGDWLSFPTQRLAGLTGGAVFHDPEGVLSCRRDVLRWYPDDVWRLVLASAWLRVSQHQAFIGRTGARGDDLGSRLLAARLAREHIRLAFLVERVWAPYDKWLGTAFLRLPSAATLRGVLDTALATADWREREAASVRAASLLLEATNRLSLAPVVDPAPRGFHARDIRVVDADLMVAGLLGSITDPAVTALSAGQERTLRDGARVASVPGAVDQVTDNVDVLTRPVRSAAVAAAANVPPEEQADRRRR